MTQRLKLGQLLLDTGMLSQAQLDRALGKQVSDPRRLGEILVQEGVITEAQLTQVLSQQLSMPWVALQHIDFSRQLLNLVPTETAERYGIVPVYVRRARNRQQTLYVAMQDPLDLEPLREIEAHSGLPVRPLIAPPSDIRAAVRAYYLGLPEEEEIEEIEAASVEGHPRGVSLPPPAPRGEPSVDFEDDDAPETPRQHFEAPPPPERFPAPPVSDREPSAHAQGADQAEPVPEDALEEVPPPPPSRPVGPRASDMPQPKAKAKAPRMVMVTMLDGTQIALPAAGRRARRELVGPSAGPADEAAAAGLTARDLVDALRARAGGVDASEVLGENVNWEKMFAALLSLLLKKHLISDWEFVRELRR